jgi:hypothetical protein
MAQTTFLILPNFRMDRAAAPDEWTDREVACVLDENGAVRASGADVLVEDVRTGQEVWIPLRRIQKEV